MDTGNAHVAALEFVAQSLRESTHRKFAGRVGACPAGAMIPNTLERFTMCARFSRFNTGKK